LTVDNASDVARHAADMLLLQKDLNVIVDGVRQGRHTFANIIKYLNITASSNFGNVFTVLFASLFIPFIPMMAIQLLLLNLIYDVSQLALPWDKVDEEQVRKPGQWNADNIGRVMLVMGPISSIFDVATFAVMWFIFAANTEASQALFHTGWFVESLLSQTLVVHLLRTAKVPFLQSVASWPLTVSTLLVILIGVVLPYSPFAADLGLTALPTSYFFWLVLILGGYCLLSQQVKNYYCKRFGRWF
jgi:P-type Mg2+ transporter